MIYTEVYEDLYNIISLAGDISYLPQQIYHAEGISFVLKEEALIKENKLVDLSMEFAVLIVELVDKIEVKKSGYMLNQLGRSGTSIGANICEAQYAHSRADFVAKMEISLKEAYETSYWLELLFKTGRINEETYKQTNNLCGNIRRLLIASCKTAKENNVK